MPNIFLKCSYCGRSVSPFTVSGKFHTRKIKHIWNKENTFLLENKKMILLGVIHKARTLGGGKGGSAKSVLARIGGRREFQL